MTVRIIGGKYRGRKILVKNARIRPTTDMMRERLFDWLGSLSGKRCLDLFAGSGALGFEAISRGAEEVTFVDLDSENLRHLRSIAGDLPGIYFFYCAEIPRRLNRIPSKPFDLIFLDPPFHHQLLRRTLPHLVGYLRSGSLIYTESEVGLSIIFPEATVIKHFQNSKYQASLWYYRATKLAG